VLFESGDVKQCRAICIGAQPRDVFCLPTKVRDCVQQLLLVDTRKGLGANYPSPSAVSGLPFNA
jgi:hypothetical protein